MKSATHEHALLYWLQVFQWFELEYRVGAAKSNTHTHVTVYKWRWGASYPPHDPVLVMLKTWPSVGWYDTPLSTMFPIARALVFRSVDFEVVLSVPYLVSYSLVNTQHTLK
jgi:hypothetical protein